MSRRSSRLHRIADIKFSEAWCLCTCGVLVQSEDRSTMNEDWVEHRKQNGLATPSLSRHGSDEWMFNNARMVKSEEGPGSHRER